MFVQFWIIWATIGLFGAIWLFWWSLRTRQFADSRRASLLPFDDVRPDDDARRKRGSGVFITFVVLMGLGIMSAVYLLIQAFSH